MAQNNYVKLIGNMGSEARMITLENDSIMAAFSLATQDSYKDKEDKWVNKDSIWHNVLCFNPSAVQKLKGLKTGTRIEVIGSLSYKDIEAIVGEGENMTVKQASVVANKVDLALLVPGKK